MLRNVTFLISVSVISSCTILTHNMRVYSGTDADIKSVGFESTKKSSPKTFKHCNHVVFLIPLSNKNQFEVLDDFIASNEGHNALANVTVESDFLQIPLLYYRFCHRIHGTPIQLEQKN